MAQLKMFIDILDNNYKNDKLEFYDIGIYNEDYPNNNKIKESYIQFMKSYINNYLTQYSNNSDDYNGLFYLDYSYYVYFGNEFKKFKKFKTNNDSNDSLLSNYDILDILFDSLLSDDDISNDDNNELNNNNELNDNNELNNNIISDDLYPLKINFNDLWYKKAKIYMLNNNLFYIKNSLNNETLEESLNYLISQIHALFDINNLIVKRINLPNIILQDTNPILTKFKIENSNLLEHIYSLYYNIPTIQNYMNDEDININKKRKII
jgi:hypothetical protein